MELLRTNVGEDCAIALRFSMDALRFRGVYIDEALSLVAVADPYVDLWDVNLGEHTDCGPSRFTEHGYQFEWTARLREAPAKPIRGVGRLTDPDRMAEYVRSGVIDLVGGARPSIADPFLPAKIRDGRYDDIRECIWCNVCVLKAEVGGHIGCTQNATAGEEYRRGWNPESFTVSCCAERAVLVRRRARRDGMRHRAGLMWARRAPRRPQRRSRRPHRWTSSMPGFGQWARTIDWRTAQLEQQAGVEVILNTPLDSETILDHGAHLVVLATGAGWSGEGMNVLSGGPLEGADSTLPHVLSPSRSSRRAIDSRDPPCRCRTSEEHVLTGHP